MIWCWCRWCCRVGAQCGVAERMCVCVLLACVFRSGGFDAASTPYCSRRCHRQRCTKPERVRRLPPFRGPPACCVLCAALCGVALRAGSAEAHRRPRRAQSLHHHSSRASIAQSNHSSPICPARADDVHAQGPAGLFAVDGQQEHHPSPRPLLKHALTFQSLIW